MRIAIVAAVALLTLAADLTFWTSKAGGGHPPAAAPASARAGLVWRSGGMVLRLTDHACPFEEMALLLETDGVPPARAYVVTQGEHKATGCWARDIGGDVLTRSPSGQEGTIPLDWFKSEPGL